MDESKIIAYARVCPARSGESTDSIEITTKSIACGGELYDFHKVYAGTDSTVNIYHDSVEPLIRRFLSGYNVCVLVFGEGGSGKSYTLAGTVHERNAFIPLAVNDIFQSNAHNIRIEAYELLGDAVKDLLSTNSDPFNLAAMSNAVRVNRFDHTAGFVEGITSQLVESVAKCTKAFKTAWDNRTMDPSSTRGFNASHLHATVVISLIRQDNVNKLFSRLSFIKLPCSDGLSDQPLSRRGHPSLLRPLRSFRKLVMDLSDISNAINANYFDSKLTQILREALGGNCISCLFVTLNPLFKKDGQLELLLRCARHVQDITNYPIINTRAAVGLLKMYYKLLERAEQGKAGNELANTQVFDDAQDYAKKAYDQMGEIDTLRSRVKELESKLGHTVSECASLEKKLLQSKEELLKVKKELLTTQRQVIQQGAESEDEIHKKKQELLLLEKQNSELMSDLTRLRLESDTVIGRTEKLQGQRDKATEDYLQLKLKHEVLSQEVNSKTGENDELKMQMVSLITSKQALEQEIDGYKVECAALKARIDGFSSGYQAKQTTTNGGHLEHENTSLKERVQHLETALANIQSKPKTETKTVIVPSPEMEQQLQTYTQLNQKLQETNQTLEHKHKQLSEVYRSRLERYIQDITSHIQQQTSGSYPQHSATMLISYATEMIHSMAESYNNREKELEMSLKKAHTQFNDLLTYLNQVATENATLKRLLTRNGVSTNTVELHPPNLVLNKTPGELASTRSLDQLSNSLDTALRKLSHISHEAPANFKHHLTELYRQLVRVKGQLLVTRSPLLANGIDKSCQEGNHQVLQQLEQQNVSLISRCTIAEAQVQELQKYIAKVLNERTILNK